jgi:hypothetical protein
MHVNEFDREHEDVPRREPEAPAIGVMDLRASTLLQLQQGAGNQAVARMLARTQQRLIQREESDDESESETDPKQKKPAKIAYCDGVKVDRGGGMPTWEMDGKRYHLNLLPDDFHITEEGRDEGKTARKGGSGLTKTHYFFEAVLTSERGKPVWTMKNAVGSGGVPGSKKKFSQLPRRVQNWFAKWYETVSETVK